MNRYQGYAYSYPHKTAYGALDPPVPLADLWRDERKDALFLYFHVPFCEMRCGFCNLFTRAVPKREEIGAYLRALARQAVRVRAALGEPRFARMAIGGGTPSYLGAVGLATLFDVAERTMGVSGVPCSVEVSPGTTDAEVTALLRDRGVTRVSIGVETFDDRELTALGRPEAAARSHSALDCLRHSGFPTLNVDLIYGIPGQTAESWRASIRAALEFAPEELYLYPLYVRPLTGLSSRPPPPDGDRRLALYRVGRDVLLDARYEQLSMRMFRRRGAPLGDGPAYCCQDDGMVGLGCGARSYTRALHYATRYAVTREGVRGILTDYASRTDADFDAAEWGTRLDGNEQRRRFVIKSVLRTEGLAIADYRHVFGSDPFCDLPLAELVTKGLARRENDRLSLTREGLELSDAVGPWLYSQSVVGRMSARLSR